MWVIGMQRLHSLLIDFAELHTAWHHLFGFLALMVLLVILAFFTRLPPGNDNDPY